MIAPTEFLVFLNDSAVDDYGIGYEDHCVNVSWDAGITPDWNAWLELFRESDGNPDWTITKLVSDSTEFIEF